MINSLTLPSPGKLNLFLHITGRKPDGYHLLQSVIQFFDYCDELTFTPRTDCTVELLNNLTNLAPSDNLIYKAAILLQKEYGIREGVSIAIQKKLPLGAGIGGGSSNAATTLLALNKLWDLNLPLTTLCQLGLKLGADVPLFVNGTSAEMRGIGELLTPIHLAEPWYLIAIPNVHVSTPTLYQHPELTRNTSLQECQNILQQGGHNDFEHLACKLYPEIRSTLAWLNSIAKAQLTGSGCAIFTACPSEANAREIATTAPASIKTIVAKGVNLSPTHRAIEMGF